MAVDRNLFEAEESLRIIRDAIDVGLWRCDETGTIRFVNPAGCRILGRQRRELLNTTFQQWSGLFGPNWSEVRMHLDRAAHGGRGTFLTHLYPKSSIRTVGFSYYPIQNGKFLGTVGLIRDITDEAELLQKLCALRDEFRGTAG